MMRRDQGAQVIRPKGLWRPGAPWRAAAAILVVAGAALTWRGVSRMYHMYHERQTGTTRTLASARQFATGVGIVDSLVLPDSSRVLLGPSSTLTIPDGYGHSSRTLTVRGQAYFDVRHDASRPFVVSTPAALLIDVGTKFVLWTDGAEALRVDVIEGAVAVRAVRAPSSASDTLRASDRGVMLTDRVIQVERGAATDADVAWMTQKVVLRNAPIGQLGTELARWYGLHLRVTDSALRTRHLTATFEHATRDEVARVLAAMLGGTARLAGDTLWIVPASGSPTRR
jgi:ferric-dicitrate binding protein FerR (iron transport regulator)